MLGSRAQALKPDSMLLPAPALTNWVKWSTLCFYSLCLIFLTCERNILMAPISQGECESAVSWYGKHLAYCLPHIIFL